MKIAEKPHWYKKYRYPLTTAWSNNEN